MRLCSNATESNQPTKPLLNTGITQTWVHQLHQHHVQRANSLPMLHIYTINISGAHHKHRNTMTSLPNHPTPTATTIPLFVDHYCCWPWQPWGSGPHTEAWSGPSGRPPESWWRSSAAQSPWSRPGSLSSQGGPEHTMQPQGTNHHQHIYGDTKLSTVSILPSNPEMINVDYRKTWMTYTHKVCTYIMQTHT